MENSLINSLCPDHQASSLHVCMNKDCGKQVAWCSICNTQLDNQHKNHNTQVQTLQKYLEMQSKQYKKIQEDKDSKLKRYLGEDLYKDYQHQYDLKKLADRQQIWLEDVKRNINYDLEDVMLQIQEIVNHVREQSFQSLDQYHKKYLEGVTTLEKTLKDNEEYYKQYKHRQFPCFLQQEWNRQCVKESVGYLEDLKQGSRKYYKERKEMKEKLKNKIKLTKGQIDKYISKQPKYTNLKFNDFKITINKQFMNYFNKSIYTRSSYFSKHSLVNLQSASVMQTNQDMSMISDYQPEGMRGYTVPRLHAFLETETYSETESVLGNSERFTSQLVKLGKSQKSQEEKVMNCSNKNTKDVIKATVVSKCVVVDQGQQLLSDSNGNLLLATTNTTNSTFKKLQTINKNIQILKVLPGDHTYKIKLDDNSYKIILVYDGIQFVQFMWVISTGDLTELKGENSELADVYICKVYGEQLILIQKGQQNDIRYEQMFKEAIIFRQDNVKKVKCFNHLVVLYDQQDNLTIYKLVHKKLEFQYTTKLNNVNINNEQIKKIIILEKYQQNAQRIILCYQDKFVLFNIENKDTKKIDFQEYYENFLIHEKPDGLSLYCNIYQINHQMQFREIFLSYEGYKFVDQKQINFNNCFTQEDVDFKNNTQKQIKVKIYNGMMIIVHWIQENQNTNYYQLKYQIE